MKKTLGWVSILIALVLLLPSAGSAGKVRGVTDTEVVIGWTTPLSGPAALWGGDRTGRQSLGRLHQRPGRDSRTKNQGDFKR